MRNIVLIGISGSGKSTLGRLAAKALHLPFWDLDADIELRTGLSASQIFAKHGEEYFRELESRVVNEAAEKGGWVIATGGGAVLRDANVRALQKNGLLIFLDRPVADILNGADLADRPLLALSPEYLYELEKKRRPLYLAAADYTLPCSGTPDDTLAALLRLLQSKTKEKQL